MATVAEKLEMVAGIVEGRAWGADRGMPRVYLPLGAKSTKKGEYAYVDFPDFDGRSLGAPKLVKATYEPERHFAPAVLAVMAIRAGDVELARRIVTRGVDMEEVDTIASAITNGRFDEARAFVAND